MASDGYLRRFQGETGLDEAAFDEAGTALDCADAVPDGLDEVAEGGTGQVGGRAAFQRGPDALDGTEVGAYGGSR